MNRLAANALQAALPELRTSFVLANGASRRNC
jgi:hypothetical protein